MVNRAAPPGSMRYFALLYAPAETRNAATALLVVASELWDSVQSPSHDVAHTRLQWWRLEIDRLVNGNAQHPATRVLQTFRLDKSVIGKLHELIAATDMDLARMTYANERELRAYCSRSGGSVSEVLAHILAPADTLHEETSKAANRLGALIRATEILRDVRQDAYDGRLYLPLDLLDRHTLKHDDLKARDLSPSARRALAALSSDIHQDFAAMMASIRPPARAYLRPLCVLAELHLALLSKLAARDYDVGAERIELGALQKPWLAWRAARRAK